jgi:hypothetical protein
MRTNVVARMNIAKNGRAAYPETLSDCTVRRAAQIRPDGVDQCIGETGVPRTASRRRGARAPARRTRLRARNDRRGPFDGF